MPFRLPWLCSAAGLLIQLTSLPHSLAHADQWQAGVARVNITPHELLWLSGYAARDKPAQGKLHDLWAKALALEDAAGHRAVLVTMDLVGVGRELSRKVCAQIEKQFNIPRAAIVLNASHTHTGPVVAGNLEPMYDLDARQRQLVDDYAAELIKNLVNVAGEALQNLKPARLSYGVGEATIAVNRRNNPEGQVPKLRANHKLVGPFDHDVPVLAVHDPDGQLVAVAAGYACHATVLADYRYSGDWPGAAQIAVEERHPGAVALYWAGCGGDSNPLPRRSVALVRKYGDQFADAVDGALAGPLTPLDSTLQFAYREIDLPFGEPPSRAELQAQITEPATPGHWARRMLVDLDRNGALPSSYPYPVQLWRLGDKLNWIFLGGEVVVDYSLKLKAEHGRDHTWVAAYSNDVMGYIPSRRVLDEGGYEGGGARLPYGLPALWDPRVEDLIHAAVRDQLSGLDQ
jgi:hypothetical protein